MTLIAVLQTLALIAWVAFTGWLIMRVVRSRH